MKMYLSSYRLGDNPERLATLYGANKTVAVIINATDGSQTQEERVANVSRECGWLRDLGLTPSEIDLREYFGKTDELRERLRPYGGVWVRGGNSFNLLRATRQSGFDKIILEKSKEKEFVYGGYSAGIDLLCPDLHGIELVDPPNEIPPGYNPELIWEGLGILDYYVAPHYRSPHPESERVEKLVEYYEKHNMPYKALRDGEVIIKES